jgi:SAM-dependent methyltransferase
VNYYLEHPGEAEIIAKAGQARTLRDHTYTIRMAHTAEILTRHLRYQHEQKRLPNLDPSTISYGHTFINAVDVTTSMTSAWRNQEIPARQRALVQLELNEMYRGNLAVPFKVLSDILRPAVGTGSSILERGCASGYYYEILEYLLNRRINYTGLDYSETMIEMAKDYYPEATFFTADGANLFFADRHFSIVISSCVLLHVPNWRQHVFETVRVAKNFVVASRTPVCKNSPTRYMKKYAYGIETVELQFNEAEFVGEFLLNGLELVDAIQYHTNPADDAYETTYLFKRAM